MRKNIIIILLLVLVLIQLGYTSYKTVSNPSLMHMHRREFIAAGIAQGMAAAGEAKDSTPNNFAIKVLDYTNALMLQLDEEEDK
jgi:hypothetical protein